MSTTGLLQQALQNLHVSQQARDGMSLTPRSISQPGTPRKKAAGGGTSMGRSPSAPGTPRSEASNGASRGESGEDSSGDEIVEVGNDTRPGTPLPGKGLTLGMRAKKDRGKDPVRTGLAEWSSTS